MNVAEASTSFTGAQKAAMVVMSLGEDQAAALLEHMSDGSLAKLHRAATNLKISEIQDTDTRSALVGFLLKQQKGAFSFGDPDERLRKALLKAKGEENVKRIYAEYQPADDGGKDSRFGFLEGLPREELAAALESESPRGVAVFLSCLPAQKAGRILNLMKQEVKEAEAERIVSLESVPPEVKDAVISGLREKLEQMNRDSSMLSEEKRSEELAHMLQTLDKESQDKVLDRLRERDAEMADRLEQLMFRFEDLTKVQGKSVQAFLRSIDVSQLALALKGAPDAVRDHLFSNLSERVREQVQEEMELAGRVPLSKVLETREEIMKPARQMYRDGSLVVQKGDDQYVE